MIKWKFLSWLGGSREKVKRKRIKSGDAVWKLYDVFAGYSKQEDFLEEINLEVKRGEKIAVIGSQRSGRRMLLRVMAGLRPVRKGRMQLLDFETQVDHFSVDWDCLIPRDIRSRMGVCLDADGLLSNVVIREGLELLFRFRYGDHTEKLRHGAKQVVEELGKDFGLDAVMEYRPFELSPAERKMASIARAFLAKPPLMLIENPTENIGVINRRRLWKVLTRIFASKDRTVILSTEDLQVAWNFCDRWVLMDGYKIEFDGSREEFLESNHPLVNLMNPSTFTKNSEHL